MCNGVDKLQVRQVEVSKLSKVANWQVHLEKAVCISNSNGLASPATEVYFAPDLDSLPTDPTAQPVNVAAAGEHPFSQPQLQDALRPQLFLARSVQTATC